MEYNQDPRKSQAANQPSQNPRQQANPQQGSREQQGGLGGFGKKQQGGSSPYNKPANPKQQQPGKNLPPK
jgi:hypothetical protein